MLQFTPKKILLCRRNREKILSSLRDQVNSVCHHLRIPETGIASWNGYYACPRHSVPLTFDISSPDHHVCPVDGEVFTGEPYTGAWWRQVNTQNQMACHHAALIWMLTGDQDALSLSIRIMTEYARYYPGYEVHGNVPYNNPGKANAQTLCDAAWIKGFLCAYDIIREELDEESKKHIENNLLRCCCEFLMDQKSDQLHNHEIVIQSSIAITGILLDDAQYLDFGLDSKYGLRYQFEHGMLADGFWFEGSAAYHFYVLDQYIAFESFAWNTEHSFLKTPGFIEALTFPLRLVQPDGMLPPLNDVGSGYRGFDGNERIYELAYSLTGDLDCVRMLNHIYREKNRNNLYSFFFGAEELPEVEMLPPHGYHSDLEKGSGLSSMTGPDGRFLLVKHSPFGGEHDHYDRLGIHFVAFGKQPIPDIGTCLYGAPLHYNYYKNTASHNTVCINSANQPPANCKVLFYEKDKERTILDTSVKWDGSYEPLDSFTIPQWSTKAYEGVEMRRVIAWFGDFFIDLFLVQSPDVRMIDWTIHIRGQSVDLDDSSGFLQNENASGARKYLKDMQAVDTLTGEKRLCWDLGDKDELEVFSFFQSDCKCFLASGPDNPSTRDLSYLTERVEGTKALFIHVICAKKEGAQILKQVDLQRDGDALKIVLERTNGRSTNFIYNLGREN